LTSRRFFLWLVGVLVCAYALAVLYYVSSVPDLGLKTIFGPAIKDYAKGYVLAGPENILPEPGDVVIRVGSRPIRTWPDLLNAPSALQKELDEALEAKKLPEWARHDGKAPGEYQVRVWFRREATDGARSVDFSCWCVLGQLPLEELFPALLWFCLKLLFFVVGVLVLWKRPGDPASVQFFVVCVVTLGAYIGGYHWAHVSTSPPLLIGFIVCAVMLPAATLHFYLVFPRPKRWLADHKPSSFLLIYGLPVLLLVTILAVYGYLRNLYHQPEVSTDEIETYLHVLVSVIYFALVSAGVFYVLSIAALVHSYRSTPDATERNQAKCLLLGAVLSLFPIGYSLILAIFFPNSFGAGGATWPMFAASVCVTAAFVVGITRYRLMELDKIISSGVMYFLISFLVGLAYWAVVFLGAMLFNHVLAGPPLGEALKVSGVALVLMLMLDLARNRFKKALDQRFHREKYHLDRTLQRMSEAVQQLVDPPTLVQRLLHASSDLLGATRGAVYLRCGEPTSFRLAGWEGPAPAQVELPAHSALPEALRTAPAVLITPWRAPLLPPHQQLRSLDGEVVYGLAHEGRLLAFLVLGPRLNGPYRQEDLNLLGAFAQITVLALGSAEGHQMIEVLNKDLQAKVEKIAEQQRRITTLQGQLRRQESGIRSPESGVGRPGEEPKLAGNGSGQRELSAVIAESSSLTPETRPLTPGIIGSGPQVQQLLHMVRKVSPTDAVVLIRGESGTGKELLAEAIHQNSPRAGKAFVKVHCAALSATLLESELFGHVKGAFTGAHRDKVGRFEMANGGTLLLDEVGDISLEVQTKLLRVLQERTIERVGSSEPLKVDVRILAATHQNLEELIKQGRFRDDLYYRLNVFPVQVPPLRQRREDIPELTLHFLQQACRNCGKEYLHLEDEALAALKAYHWPGNIRQLESFIARAVVLVEGSTVTLAELPEEVRQASGSQSFDSWTADVLAQSLTPPGHNGSHIDPLDAMDRDRLLRALAAAGGNKAQAARNLGLARSTLVSRLKKYGML
jgi:transcriptional regulator with GAF, ATPase, and Fis domain